jgi:hypothetical protein
VQRLDETRRRQRKLVLVVADDERATNPGEPEFAGLQHPAVVVAEDGNEDGERRSVVRARPVDVEVPRVVTGGTVLEDVPPPPVGRVDGHVVGHDVQQLSEARVVESAHHAGVSRRPAKLGVQPVRVDDVVAVCAPGRCLEIGRAVDV